MQELRFGGEWILAEDETLVADGHEQRYLYLVVSGEVAITKINDQGKTQQIATLGTGAAFGEMAFLVAGWHRPMCNPSGRPFSGGWIMSSYSDLLESMAWLVDSSV